MSITAAQMIYANVERQQSPKNTGGFQTLFYTHDCLTKEEISRIEQRLLYYPGFGDPVKKVFFTLEGGKTVLARIVSLPGVDSYGRKGKYLAHALIFREQEWQTSQADPLNILNSFPFITTVEQALAQGEFSTGRIGSAVADARGLPKEGQFALWDRKALARISLFALRAADLYKERQTLAFTGTPADMEAALEPVLHLIPAALRVPCSFDTFFYNCNAVSTYFWAVGLPQPSPGGRFIIIDAARRMFQSEESLSPLTAFERWVVSRILADQAAVAGQHIETAWMLCQWLEGKILPERLPETVLESLLREIGGISPEFLAQRVYVRLTDTLPEPLAQPIADRLHLTELTPARYAELRKGFALPRLLDMVFEHFTRPGGSQPSKLQISSLTEVLGRASHTGLELLLAGWSGDWNTLRIRLAKLSDAGYRDFLIRVLSCSALPPTRLLIQGKGEIFVSLCMKHRFPVAPAELLVALLENGECNALIPLTDSLYRLSHRELKAVRSAAGDQTLPDRFSEALNRAEEKAVPPGILSHLSRFLDKKRTP